MRALARVMAGVAVLGALAFGASQQAHAEELGQFHLPEGKRICIEDHRWTRWNDALPGVAWRLSKYVQHTVVWDDCSSQPDNQVITLQVVYDSQNAFCARTVRGGYVGGVATGRTTIQVNMSSKWFDRCHATAAQRQHLMSHEIGHAFGLVHRSGASVMASWSYNWYTSTDYSDLRSVYQH